MSNDPSYTDLRKVVDSVVGEEERPGVSYEDAEISDEEYLLRRIAWIVREIDKAESQDFARLQKEEEECKKKGTPGDSLLASVYEARRLWTHGQVPPLAVWQKLCQAYRLCTPLSRVTQEEMIALFADLSFEVMCLQCQGYLLMVWADTCSDPSCGSREHYTELVDSPTGEWELTLCKKCNRKWRRVVTDVCGGPDGNSADAGCGWRKPKS